MTAAHGPRRRDLGALLALGALGPGLLAGCSPGRVATSPDVPRDPLAELEAELWDSRSAADLLAQDVEGADDLDLTAAREEMVRFVEAAYLSPETLRTLPDAQAWEHIRAATPSYWEDNLQVAWDASERLYYAHSPAEGFRTVGSPAISSSWFRREADGIQLLLLGATIAWAEIETASHRVGVCAFRVGIRAELDADGAIPTASLRVTLHGMDLCAMQEGDGLTIPALGDDEAHVSAREETARLVLASPRLGAEDLLDEESAVLEGDEATNVLCG